LKKLEKVEWLTEFGNLDLTISFFAALPETFPLTGLRSLKILSYFGWRRVKLVLFEIKEENYLQK
jgi:hypothetical protein